MSKKILFIEDDKDFLQLVSSYLSKAGLKVQTFTSGRQALVSFQKDSFDLVILDLGLPDIGGLSLCRKIRKATGVPILILTAREGVPDRVAGLDAGADDYLVKPISLGELAVRVVRLLERDLSPGPRSAVFSFGGVDFDTVSGELRSGERSLELTPKERAVLEYLALNSGRVLTRMEIMDHVWGDELNPFSNNVNMVISSLRAKLRQLTSEEFIYSVQGLGYKFKDLT